jgi:putative redox protein
MAGDFAVTVRTDGTTIEAENGKGGRISIGNGSDEQLNPVELMLAAVGGCAVIDFGTTSRKRKHDVGPFAIEVRGERAQDARLSAITVTYRLAAGFSADDPEVQTALRLTRDVLCTVSRTIAHGATVTHVVAEPEPQPAGRA